MTILCYRFVVLQNTDLDLEEIGDRTSADARRKVGNSAPLFDTIVYHPCKARLHKTKCKLPNFISSVSTELAM